MKVVYSCLVILCFLFLSIKPALSSLPLDDFVKHGDYLDLKLSPDGKHLAARVRADNRVFMVILETNSMKPVGGLKPDKRDIIHSVNWVSNERVVFEYAEKTHNFDQPIPTGELYAANIDNSHRLMIYGYRAGDAKVGSRISNREDNFATQEILSYLEHDKKHILIIEYPWSKEGNTYYDARKREPIISKLNVFNGKKRKVEVLPHPGAVAFANRKGEVKFMSWRTKEGDYFSGYRQNSDAPWQDLGTALGISDSLSPVKLSKNGQQLILLGRPPETGILTYYQYDFGSATLTTLFTGHKTDIESYTSNEAGVPAVALTFPGASEYVYSSVESRTVDIHKMLAEAFAGQTAMISSRSADGSKLLVHVSSDINPGEYYLFQRDTLKAKFLWANASWIDPRTLSKMMPVQFNTDDDVTLNGYLTLPKHTTAKKPPLVVMIHGGPHQPGTRDYWEYNPEVQLMANEGYAVLQVNYRGSYGYGDEFRKKGYREWGGKMIDDITFAANWAIDKGYVDGNSVCVYGASYGGYAALMSAVKAPDLYKCAIGYVGIYDLNFMFTESDIPNSWGGKEYLQRVLGNDPQQLRAFSPLYHVDKIKANVMLIHGSKDTRVPEVNSEALYNALKKQGKTPLYLKYKQAGHGVYDEQNRKELYQGLLNFLARNIKGA